MGLQFILVLCLAGAFCLAPLAVYLLWIAKITRRTRPTVFAGTWDFIGLLVGLSGFIVFGGGLALSLLQSNFRYWMRGNFDALREAGTQEKFTWILLACVYLLLVLVVVGFTLAARRRTLVVYNIDPAAFESMAGEVCEHLNHPVERRGNLFSSKGPLFELDRFPRGRTVTLRWLSGDVRLFQDVERLVREAVRSHASDENPFSQWLLAAALGAIFAAVACFGILLYALRMV